MNRYDELQKLQELKNQGALTDAEFEAEKARLLSQPESPAASFDSQPPPPPAVGRYWGMDANTYCMLLHLSQLSGFVLLGLGFILPIVMWAMHKDQSPEIDAHGKVVLNWMITALIAFAVCFVLAFVFIGIPLMFLLGLVSIIYAIVGGLKAKDGILWPYPGTIRFLG